MVCLAWKFCCHPLHAPGICLSGRAERGGDFGGSVRVGGGRQEIRRAAQPFAALCSKATARAAFMVMQRRTLDASVGRGSLGLQGHIIQFELLRLLRLRRCAEVNASKSLAAV